MYANAGSPETKFRNDDIRFYRGIFKPVKDEGRVYLFDKKIGKKLKRRVRVTKKDSSLCLYFVLL